MVCMVTIVRLYDPVLLQETVQNVEEDNKVVKATTHKVWEKPKRRKKGGGSTKAMVKNKVKKKLIKQDQPAELLVSGYD